MTKLFNLFGRKKAEPEIDWEAKFKKAVTDLERQAEEHRVLSEHALALEAAVAQLRPDALAMRRKRQMDRDRRAGKGVVS